MILQDNLRTIPVGPPQLLYIAAVHVRTDEQSHGLLDKKLPVLPHGKGVS